MKNYRKIYNRLIKEIQSELDAHYDCISRVPESNEQIIELIEEKYGITVLKWIISLLPEIEGKECKMITMNQKEFKKWKKNIKN